MDTAGSKRESCFAEPWFLLEDAKRTVEDALHRDAESLIQETDSAQTALVRLRDCLIERLRESEEGTERKELDQVNTILSLVAGVEYPLSSIHRKTLEGVGRLLERITIPRTGSTEFPA